MDGGPGVFFHDFSATEFEIRLREKGPLSYRCATCGGLHEDLPHLGIDKPDPWWDVAEKEREARVELTSDTCIIDGEHFFIRGVIEIPVHDYPDPFGFGVWVSQKRENFFEYAEHPYSAEIGPFFGWFCTRLTCYSESTLLLKTMAHFRGGGLRPAIELEPTDHPLAVDQREGIGLRRAWEIIHHYQPQAGA